METSTKNNSQSTEKPLVYLTEAAVAKIKSMMAKEGKEGYGLRVGVVTGGCAGLSYELRFQKNHYENDTVFTQGDLNIFINAEALSSLKGLEIHYVDTLKESGFQYRNPNAKSSCGCGTSFS